MTFVPNGRLESLSALAADTGTTLRVELFSCRKAVAMHKKRERQSGVVNGGSPTSEVEPPTTPLSGESGMGAGLLEAGSTLEAFARSTSYSDDSALPMFVPALVASMNAMYAADGFDFSGVLAEEHFVHFTDAFEFESAVPGPAAAGIEWPRVWKVVSEVALAKDTSGSPTATPGHGPSMHVGEWAELFQLRPDCPFVPTTTSASGEEEAPPSHFFAYCRKTRLMVVLVVGVVGNADETQREPEDE